ncbi:MAG: sterol desaturase family protein, partial [Pseudomonadota bacterium]|nr:sterol desaturase family protein [Pseudomonadota bacterium]
SWLFYLPMALLGVPLRVFIVVALIDLLYQFWVHTEQIGKLGWFDRVFVSPSNHRAHHGVNDLYLDKNYGGILILWDRLFGTFVEEHDAHPVVYGTRSPLRSWNPVLANLDVYRGIWFTLRHASGWRVRWRALFGRPGWQPANTATQPSATFDLARTPYQPVLATRTALYCLAQLGLLLLVATHFLATHGKLAVSTAAAYGLWLACGLWLIGGMLEMRPAYRWLNFIWLAATLVGIIMAGQWFGLPLGAAARAGAAFVTLAFALAILVLPRSRAGATVARAGQVDPA